MMSLVKKTFQAVTKWKADIDDNLEVDGVSIPVVLLANKIDLADKPLEKEMMDKFCKEHKFIGWFETSAKDNVNIDEAGNFLVDHILKHDPKAQRNQQQAKDPSIVKLGNGSNSAPPETKESGCRC